MMQVRNLTPHAHLVYANEDAQHRLFDILIVKSSYHLDENYQLVLSPEQEPMTFTDTCYGAVNETSLRTPSDLVPYKPVTDVVVVADSHAPKGKPQSDWICSVGVSGPAGFTKDLRVTGPRDWQHSTLRGWTLGAPAKVDHVPLRYELAYGGEILRDKDDITTDERNPLGQGLIDRHTPRDTLVPAPQIEAKGQPIRDPMRRYEPQGFGAIPPAWLPRRPLGGTYDQNWIDNVWPHWAADYDFAFHNAAAGGMKADGFLAGDETLTLTNLRHDAPDLTLTLPGDKVLAHLVDEDGNRKIVALNLDTVYVDILPDDPMDCLIALTWRLPFLDSGLRWLEIDSTVVVNPIRMWAQGDGIMAAPHPSELFTQTPMQEMADVQ